MRPTLPEKPFGWWLHYYPVANLRFLLRCFSFTATFSILIVLLVEIFSPVNDYYVKENGENGDLIQTNAFGGTECELYRGRLRLPAQIWHVYSKIQGVFLSAWLISRISVLFFPLFYGNWLYRKQEKLYTFRTNVVIISFFNMFPLLFLCYYECMVIGWIFFGLAFGVFFALLLDRILIRDNDYYLLQINDDVALIPLNRWEKGPKKKKEPSQTNQK